MKIILGLVFFLILPMVLGIFWAAVLPGNPLGTMLSFFSGAASGMYGAYVLTKD